MNEIGQSTELLSGELLGYCASDSLSEDGLREIIDRNGLKPNNSNVSDYRFSLAFLAACENKRVTEGIIRCLIEYFPNGASAVSGDGLPPLHYTCRNKNVTLNIIRLLVYAAPDTVRSVNNEGNMPIHILCNNNNLDETAAVDILQLLIAKHPDAVRYANNSGSLPIHLACVSKSPEFCQVLINAAPDSLSSVNRNGFTPLHCLCNTKNLDEMAAVKILKFLLEKHPAAVRHTDNYGDLPIHKAAGTKSPAFCRLLIEAYPGSDRVTTFYGALPLHDACSRNTLSTVEYFFRLYPDAIDRVCSHFVTTLQVYPIHLAIEGTTFRDDPEAAVETVKFLLNCNSNVKLQKHKGRSLLLFACVGGYRYVNNINASNIVAALQIIEAIYDAHPEAIEDILSDFYRFHQEVQEFLENQLFYARQAKFPRIMTTPDGNGRLPLHRALQDNTTLGSIKLLAKANPHALQSPDNIGALPLHISCQHHDSVNVIQYLIGLDPSSLDAVDRNGNTALHYACLGAKYDTIMLLLDKYNAVLVSTLNAENKLPIELLWESNEMEDRESIDYTDSIFRLLKAYPETLRNVGTDLKSSSQIGSGKKSCGHSLLVFIRKAMRSSRKRLQNRQKNG